ncbi:MAG: toll/interleukin-1 receptor domain-containing protein [Bacteroidota bacterium]|nr:toll/interleukin-1 receptor domain-containing protein [Bacteroidota bacterium]
MASELIIQIQNRDGSFNCEKFDHLPSPKSVYIAICFTDNSQSEQLALELKTKLITSITNLESNFNSSQPPCGGNAVGFNGCQALGIPDNLKLLVVVSDGVSNTFAEPSVLNWTQTTLPVVQLGNHVNLPNPFNIPNAVFWKNSIDEVIPTIFGLIGISEEDQRIFISYRRDDTTAFAEQLFDRLHHEGFDVFLDRFSINPAVNFQNRLYQELADKAMIVFLESPTFLSSPWIQLEIAFAKKYRLGLLALNIDGAPQIPAIDNEYRIAVSLSTTTKQIDATALDNLVAEIRQRHSVALYRMRNYLNNNIVAALESKGATTSFDNNGFISVADRAGKINYKIWATPRPPKVNDYHYTDISHASGEKVIVGPEFKENKREQVNTWLSEKSVVKYFNEGEILSLTNLIYP